MPAASIEILPVAEAQLPALAGLAGVIWHECYPGIISPAQIEFMLARMYSLATLRAEMQAQGIRFYRLLVGGRMVGFMSLGPTETAAVWKLHKLYLLAEFHGRGLGRRLLRHAEAEADRLGARRLILAVNKQNARAIAAYRRHGFVTAESVQADIGGGFVMDDFIMAKELPIVCPAAHIDPRAHAGRG